MHTRIKSSFKKKLFRFDYFLLVIAILFAIVILTSDVYLVQEVKTVEKFKIDPKKNIFSQFNDEQIPEIKIEVEPSYLKALNLQIPTGDVCKKINFKKFPVKSIELNNAIQKGEFSIRYRGFCYPHWKWRQKSIKLELESNGQKILGQSTLNLNSMDTDAFLYDMWAGSVFEKMGLISSRITLVKLYINGNYDGLRQLVENLDAELLNSYGLEDGPIYRERTHAYFGDHENLEEKWDKNNLKGKSWKDFYNFQWNIYRSIVDKSSPYEYRRMLDYQYYLRYLAAITLVGTHHLNSHNIPLYRPKSSNFFYPIGYDFADNFQGMRSHIFSDFQIPFMSLNVIHQLIFSDDNSRLDFHKLMFQTLTNPDYANLDLDYELLISKSSKYITPDWKNRLIFYKVGGPPLDFIEYGGRNLKPAKKRFTYLKKGYLDPIAYLYKDQNKAQVLIDGLGIYEFFIENKLICEDKKNGPVLSARLLNRQWVDLLTCKNENLIISKLLLERFNKSYPDIKKLPASYFKYTTGAVWVELKSHIDNFNFDDLKIKSLQTEKNIPIENASPIQFIIDEIKPKVELKTNLKYVSNEELINGEEGLYLVKDYIKEGDIFDIKEEYISLDKINFKNEEELRVVYRYPTLCWNYKSRSTCFEIIREMFMNDQQYNLLKSNQ